MGVAVTLAALLSSLLLLLMMLLPGVFCSASLSDRSRLTAALYVRAVTVAVFSPSSCSYA